MLTTLASIGSEFDRDIVEPGRLAAFLFFVALLGTFGFIRASTHMIRAQVSWWPGNVSVGGTHVHHLVWGIFAMMIFGYIGVVIQPDSPWREIVTVFFAIGMGLTLDEFALWLELKDVYWEKQGRKSVDAMIIAACLAGMLVVGISSWARLADSVATGVFAALSAVGVVAIVVALINAAKEKFGWAVGSLLIPVVGIAPAFRLAKPTSLWAKLFYCPKRLGERRMERARERYPDAGAGEAAAPASGSSSA
jgi:lysyl-tRNA synthetase class 2